MTRYSASITGTTQLFVSSVVSSSANLDNDRDIYLYLDRRQPSVVNNNRVAQQRPKETEAQQGGPLWRRDADQRTGRMWRMSGRGNGGAMGRNDPNNEPREMKWNGHLDCICCGSRGSCGWLSWDGLRSKKKNKQQLVH